MWNRCSYNTDCTSLELDNKPIFVIIVFYYNIFITLHGICTRNLWKKRQITRCVLQFCSGRSHTYLLFFYRNQNLLKDFLQSLTNLLKALRHMLDSELLDVCFYIFSTADDFSTDHRHRLLPVVFGSFQVCLLKRSLFFIYDFLYSFPENGERMGILTQHRFIPFVSKRYGFHYGVFRIWDFLVDFFGFVLHG